MADRIEEPRPMVRASEEHAADAPLTAKVGMALRRREAAGEASPHSRKFRVATAMLVGLAIGAVVVAIALADGGSKRATPVAWSDWSPPDSGNLGVAVKPDPTSSAVSLLGGTTIAYNLCGIGGANCAIGIGPPSVNRLLLLRREALELALYTFKYEGGVDNVVAILPPGQMESTGTLTQTPPSSTAPTTKPVDIAVLFVREELQPWLTQPLSDTLPEEFPPTVAEMGSAPEAGLVDQITARGLFSEKMVQAQDGSNLIELDPLPPQ